MSDTPITDWSNSATVGRFTITQEGAPTGDMNAVEFVLDIERLKTKAYALVDLMIDVETNHGGLIGTKTLRARDELRLELSRWK